MKAAAWGFLAGLMLSGSALADEPKRLPLQVDGPVMMSPWRAAAEPAPNANKNHYLYAPPAPYFYPWSFAAPWYGFPRYYGGWYRPRPIVYSPIIIRR